MNQDTESPVRPDDYVFVSYARADRDRVRPIVEALESRGRTVWWDHRLAGGSAFAREIEAALRGAKAVVVVWSQASIASDWVLDEATVGRELGHLIPVMLDGVAAPLGFGQYHAINFTHWNRQSDAAEMQQLIAALDGASQLHGPTLAAEPERRGGRLTRRAAIGGAGVAVPALIAAVWWTRTRKSPAPVTPAHSLAVLPFTNLSGDPAQDYFTDGLTEELIADLARLPALQVAGRISSFKFKDSKDDSAAIGAKLGVAYILDGAVRRQADQVRITAELIDSRTGFQRWSDTYNHDMKDILATQTSIAQAVTAQLQGTLLAGDIRTLSAGGTASPTAYDAYLQGRRAFDLGGNESHYRAALALFDKAVAADPGFAAAYAARARVLLTMGDLFAGPAEHDRFNNDALAAARRAAALAPDLSETQATLADTLATAFLDVPGARAAYARAMSIGDGQVDTLTRYGLFACKIGDIDPGLAAVRRAAALDPLNPRVFKNLGLCLVIAGRLTEGLATLRQGLSLSADLNAAHAWIGDALYLQGDLKGAAAEFALEPVPSLRLAGQAIVSRRQGDLPAAEAAYRSLLADHDEVAGYQLAQIFAQWGQRDQAFAALDAAFKAKDAGLLYLKTDAMLAPLRSDPRFATVLHRLGLDFQS